MKIALAAIAGFLAFGAVVTITGVGKTRPPLTGGVAAASVVTCGLMIAVLIWTIGALP